MFKETEEKRGYYGYIFQCSQESIAEDIMQVQQNLILRNEKQTDHHIAFILNYYDNFLMVMNEVLSLKPIKNPTNHFIFKLKYKTFLNPAVGSTMRGFSKFNPYLPKLSK